MAPNLNNDILADMISNKGISLRDLSIGQPILLVFLRHFGCTFCREALADIAKQRYSIEATGTKIVLVHMSKKQLAERYFNRYSLDNIDHISNEDCSLYKSFGLTKGNVNQLFGLKNWIRGFDAGLVKGYFVGKQMGDGFQMPGVFVIQDGEIKEFFIHRSAADRPHYLNMVNCCTLPL